MYLSLHPILFTSSIRQRKGRTISKMKISFKFLILLSVSSLFLISTRAETHIVGDSFGWNAYSDYANWAKGKTFHVGDNLVFHYEEGLHNVLRVNATAYANCVKEPNLGKSGHGNDTIALTEVGHIWYVCGVEDHCENGQKLSIEVLP